MINITLKENDNIFSVEIEGHSKSSDEPCARVVSTFDLLFIIIGKSRLKFEKGNGYSFISFPINNETKDIIDIFTLYLYKLDKLYNQIKVNEVKNNG